MTVFIGPEEWAAPRQADWERAAATGQADRDDFAEQIERQEYQERHGVPLTPVQLEQAMNASHHARVTEPAVPSYVRRSAA